MEEKIVYAVVGDAGGAKEVAPAMQMLERKYGVKVNWFVDPSPKAKAASILTEAGISFESRWPIPEDNPDLLVYGTGDYAIGAQMMWMAFGKVRNIKIIGIEDLWACGEYPQTLWLDPDLMLVINGIAADIVGAIRPGVKTKIVGKPSFEKFVDLAKRGSAIRSAVRQKLGLNETDFLVVVSLGGDGFGRTQMEAITAIVKKIIGLEAMIFAWRIHPRDAERDALWELAVSSGIRFVDARSINLEELVLAANVISASPENTDPYKAIYAGIPVITVLFPDDMKAMAARGCPKGPPIVMNHERWGVKSAEEWAALLKEVKQEEAAIREYTKTVRAKPFLSLFTPSAAERIADEIAKHL